MRLSGNSPHDIQNRLNQPQICLVSPFFQQTFATPSAIGERRIPRHTNKIDFTDIYISLLLKTHSLSSFGTITSGMSLSTTASGTGYF